MDLQEEYINRRKVPAHFIKYPDKANLILKAKEGIRTEWNWLHASIEFKQESNQPPYFRFVVAANPVIYASADFSHFSYHHSKVITESRLEWDAYEDAIVQWAKRNADSYVAVPSSEAVFVSWEMFLLNYDSWLANFLPYRVIDWLAGSLQNTNVESRLLCIKEVENWIRERYERVFMCWKNIRQNLDQKNYADWLADAVNSLGRK